MSIFDTSDAGAVRFHGERRAYWRLLSRGAALLMVTLGIYRFWLTTDVRRFLWANTEIAGDSLEYNGTPVELLTGFLIAIALLIPIYVGFFFAALDLGTFGELSGLAGVVLLVFCWQYALYRARRYRLTRTIFRGLRFHQEGSAWLYGLRALLWWTLTALTLGLAYPFQVASLERYKMRHTYYGNLGGQFTGAGWRLFLRGLPLWFLLIAPLAVTAGAALDVVDWQALETALDAGGDDPWAHIEQTNPALAGLIVFAMVMAGTTVALALLLYPAFHAMVLRWWSSSLRFGTLAMESRLRMRHVYGAYLRFVLLALVFAVALAIAAVPALFIVGVLTGNEETSIAAELAAAAILLGGYVVAALGFTTIYRATVGLTVWQLVVESLHLSGLEALARVRAQGRPSSPVGEGLADALRVGGY